MYAVEQGLEKLESCKTEHLTTTQVFTKINMNETVAKVSFWGTHLLSLARKAFYSQSWASGACLIAAAKAMQAERMNYLSPLVFLWGQLYMKLRTFRTTSVSYKRLVAQMALGLWGVCWCSLTLSHCASAKSQQRLKWMVRIFSNGKDGFCMTELKAQIHYDWEQRLSWASS